MHERLQKRQKEKRTKLEELKRSHDQQLKEKCTFAPKIEQTSIDMVAASGRTIHQRILDQAKMNNQNEDLHEEIES